MNKKKNTILIIDDEKTNILKLTHILAPEYTIFASKSGENGIEIAKANLPDVILLDVLMPEMDGYEVLFLLKNTDETREIPVIFVSGLAEPEDERKGLALGAADYISKPFNSAIVILRVLNQIKILNLMKEVKRFGLIDQLTEIPNRRSFDERLNLEWERSKREKTPLSIFMIDIDNFKLYNDTHGHLQGDTALQTIAKTLKQTLNRSTDFVARWGGEEFTVLLPNTDSKGAMTIAETIRKAVENTPILCDNDESTNTTISIGINTIIPKAKDTTKDFIIQADRALYNAKDMGKNRITSL